MRAPAHLFTFIAVSSLVVACGGSNAPAKDSSSSSGGSDPKSLTQQKRAFMNGCTKKAPDAPDYCLCAWEIFAKDFTKEEMTQVDSPADDERYQKRLASYKEEVKVSCASKMPESAIKASFLKGCSDGGKLTADYCECKYGELRKKLAASELTDDEIVKTPRFIEAKKSVAKTCTTRIAEGPVHEAFVKGCNNSGGAKEYCECGWKAARKNWSVGEIMESTMGQKDLLEKVRAVCGLPEATQK